MNTIDGYITAEDAERCRAIMVIAFDSVQDVDERNFLTPTESRAIKTSSIKKSDNWPDVIDQRNGVLVGIKEEDQELESETKIKGKIREILGPPPSKNRPSSIEDEDDLFENNSDEKAVIKVFYQQMPNARVSHWVDLDDLSPKRYKFFDDYVLVVYEPSDFISDDSCDDEDDW